MKTFQFQMEKELSQIHNNLNEKMGVDQAMNSKNKEKNVALFSEVVRLGKEFENFSEGMTGTLALINQKVQAIESKSDKAVVESKTSSSSGGDFTEMLVRYTERSETRFSQLESNIGTLVVIIKYYTYSQR